jgi:hypothetical protein
MPIHTFYLSPPPPPSPHFVSNVSLSSFSLAKPPASKAPAPKKKPISTDPDVEYLSDEDELDRDMAALGFADSSNKKGITPGLSKLKGLDSNLTTPSGTPASSRASSPLAKIPAAKRVNVLEEYAKRSTDKPKMNLVVIGKFPHSLSTCVHSFFFFFLYGRPCGRWEIYVDGSFLV